MTYEIRDKIKNGKQKFKIELLALYIASKRKDMPWYAKFFAVMLVAYALSPVDLIPDFIPVLGYIDDLIILPLGFGLVVRLIPGKIMEECRSEAALVLNENMPKNWTAGIIIILIWVLLAALIIVNISDLQIIKWINGFNYIFT